MFQLYCTIILQRTIVGISNILLTGPYHSLMFFQPEHSIIGNTVQYKYCGYNTSKIGEKYVPLMSNLPSLSVELRTRKIQPNSCIIQQEEDGGKQQQAGREREEEGCAHNYNATKLNNCKEQFKFYKTARQSQHIIFTPAVSAATVNAPWEKFIAVSITER